MYNGKLSGLYISELCLSHYGTLLLSLNPILVKVVGIRAWRNEYRLFKAWWASDACFRCTANDSSYRLAFLGSTAATRLCSVCTSARWTIPASLQKPSAQQFAIACRRPEDHNMVSNALRCSTSHKYVSKKNHERRYHELAPGANWEFPVNVRLLCVASSEPA